MNIVLKILCLIYLIPAINVFAANNANTQIPGKNKEFKIYESLGFSNKPDLLKEFGIQYLPIYGKSHFWGKTIPNDSIPNEIRIKQLAKNTYENGNTLISLDIEHWPLTNANKKVIESSRDKYIQVAKTFKENAQGIQIGFYSTLPIRNYRVPVSAKGQETYEIQKWRLENDNLQALADHVDVIMPSLYTFKDDPESWIIYARENLKEAKKYGKPVYVFLWPQYHSSNRWKRDKSIDGDFWALQLKTVYEYADGVIIWSPKINPKKWDSNSAWWIKTVQFMTEIGYQKIKH
jgi:hypothetical protein